MLALHRALSLMEAGTKVPTELSRARLFFRKSLYLDARNAAAHRGLGFVLWAEGERDLAGEEWRMGGIPYEDFVEIGIQLADAGDPESALDWYCRAMAIAPAASEPYAQAGLLLANMGQDEQALSALSQAVSFASFRSPSLRLITHSRRAGLLYKLGRTREAMLEYEWVVAHKPEDYWATLRVGALAWELDQDATRAEAMLLRAAEIGPTQKWAYSRLGDLYYDLGRRIESLKMYLRVLEIDPNDQSAQRRIQTLRAESDR